MHKPSRRRSATLGILLVGGVVLASCARVDVGFLASDRYAGRDNGTTGSTRSQQYIIRNLEHVADGLNSSQTGDAAYRQTFEGGTNVVAVIPGTDLADEYILVGAHYDHLGSSCGTAEPADTICNGATDNATGVAAVLQIARDIGGRREPPRRSVILALWDREEDGLLGSRAFVDDPLVPLTSIKAYINFDIQGANLLPSLRNTSFAIAAETGGDALRSLVDEAVGSTTLGTRQLSSIFGQGRSDYVNLIGANVPTVFFSDSTGPCYHTAQDETGIVDFGKLRKQIAIARHLTLDLANTDTPPVFQIGQPLATFQDAVTIQELVALSEGDLPRFTPAQQTQLTTFRDQINAIVADGEAGFDGEDVTTLFIGTLTVVDLLTSGPCDGFLAGPTIGR